MEVCKHCGISQGSYSELEKDANNSRFTVQIADFLGVDPVWLATGSGNEPDWTKAHGQVAPVAPSADPDAELIVAIKALDEMGKAQVMGFVAGLKQPRALGEFSTPKAANGH